MASLAQEKEPSHCEYKKLEAGDQIVDDRNVDLELSWNVDELDWQPHWEVAVSHSIHCTKL